MSFVSHVVAALACAALTIATAGAQTPQPQPRQQQPPQGAQPPRVLQQGTTEWVGAAGEQRVDNLGLNQTQVRQLQRALSDQGCPPGRIDGFLGPQTRQAIQCLQQRHGLIEADRNELLRVLGVGFTMPEQARARGGRPGQPGQPGVQPRSGQPVEQPRPARQGQPIPGPEDRRDTTRIEDRTDPSRTEIRTDPVRIVPRGAVRIDTTPAINRPPPR